MTTNIHNNSLGFTLLESLIASTIFSFAFISLATLFITSSQQYNQNQQRLLANILLSDGTERLLSFQTALKNEQLSEKLFLESLSDWQKKVAKTLPQGAAVYSFNFVTQNPKGTLTINWQNKGQEYELSRTLIFYHAKAPGRARAY